MFDLINGIPVHPLVVHAIVVLLPLATLGTLAIVARPAWRLRYGPLVVAAAAIATALMPVATASGEALEKRVGDPGQHAHLGDQLIWFAVPLLLTSAGLVWLEWRRSRAEQDPGPSTVDPGRRGAGRRGRARQRGPGLPRRRLRGPRRVGRRAGRDGPMMHTASAQDPGRWHPAGARTLWS